MKFKAGLPTLFLSSFLITPITTRPVSRRDLGGVFGGLLGPGEQGTITIPPGSSASRQEHGISGTASTIYYANGESTRVHESTGSRVTSIVAPTINEIATFSENSWPASTWSSSLASITPWPTSSPSSYAQDASHMPPGEETEWKVIGITVFCITIIGAMMLATYFSDTCACAGIGRGRNTGKRIWCRTGRREVGSTSWRMKKDIGIRQFLRRCSL